MLLLIVAIVIALVAWALRLMEQAVQGQEFSLMLAGFLVASSAAALMGVYYLMGDYMVYLDHTYQPQQNQGQPTAFYSKAAMASETGDVPPWLIRSE